MTTRGFQIRCFAMTALLVGLLSALSVRLLEIQGLDAKHYKQKAGRAFERPEKLAGLRGKILDRNEEVLAKSMPVSAITADINHLPDATVMASTVAYERVSAQEGWADLDTAHRRSRIAAERNYLVEQVEMEKMKPEDILDAALNRAVSVMARPLRMPRQELLEKIKKGIGNKTRGEFEIVSDLPDDVAVELRDTMDDEWIEGFHFRGSFKRWYPSPDMAVHVVGCMGEKTTPDGKPLKTASYTGISGVESSMNQYLTGRDGYRCDKRDMWGMKIPGDSDCLRPPVAGLNVQLTIDMAMQAIVEEELDAGLKEFVSPQGCAVVMDPKTGEVLALASRPDFNLNVVDERRMKGSRNFATHAQYEPGSTIKIVATSGALNEGLVTPQTSIFCHNGHFTDGVVDVKDEHPQGMLTFEGVLEKSNNIGTYMIARQLGMDRFYQYVRAYGYGKQTGIALGESAGVASEKRNPVDFSRSAYGYALSVTPLQVATAFSVIANDGQRRNPKVIKSLVSNDGKYFTPDDWHGLDEEGVPDEWKHAPVRVIKPSTAAEMRHALIRVTGEGGTAKAARVPGFDVAGKTGTARRMVKIDKPGSKLGYKYGYQEGHYTVTFAGMMPAENPAFVCVVVLDDPRAPQLAHLYGGPIAGAVFSKIATRLAAQMNLTPTSPVSPPKKGETAQR